MVSLGNDCCNLGGSNNLMKQRILYFFLSENNVTESTMVNATNLQGSFSDADEQMIQTFTTNQARSQKAHHPGSPEPLKEPPRILLPPSSIRSPYRAFYSFCSCRFIGKVSSVPMRCLRLQSGSLCSPRLWTGAGAAGWCCW